jgi:hypothetical protein
MPKSSPGARTGLARADPTHFASPVAGLKIFDAGFPVMSDDLPATRKSGSQVMGVADRRPDFACA